VTVLGFADEHCRTVEAAGGKGASLARMTALGLPVPAGFVVHADAMAASLPDGGAELRKAARSDRTRAPELVRSIEIGDELRGAVSRAYAELGGGEPAVAVRSSARAEDSEEASFAGQQETYLHVRGAAAVLGRIRDCWASFFSERALFYREQRGSLDDLGMAVVVQRMVSADVAGVLFTMDPVQRRRDRMVVEAVFGLGEAGVSGQVTPDHFVIARDGAVKRERLTVQPLALVSGSGGGTVERELSPEEGATPTLGADELRELARLGAALEDELGAPQDIEWALEDGELFVLQCRPVTA
jgi:pyruvate, water dikinase